MTFDLIIQEFVKKLNVYQTNQYRLESHAVYTVQFIVYVVHKSLYVFGQGSCFYGQNIFVNILPYINYQKYRWKLGINTFYLIKYKRIFINRFYLFFQDFDLELENATESGVVGVTESGRNVKTPPVPTIPTWPTGLLGLTRLRYLFVLHVFKNCYFKGRKFF